MDVGRAERAPASRRSRATSTASPSGRSSTRAGAASRWTCCSRRAADRRLPVRAELRRLHDQRAARGPHRRQGVDRDHASTTSRWNRSTAGRRGSSSRTSTSGRAPSGCAASRCCTRTSRASGRSTATTTTVTRGRSSATGATEHGRGGLVERGRDAGMQQRGEERDAVDDARPRVATGRRSRRSRRRGRRRRPACRPAPRARRRPRRAPRPRRCEPARRQHDHLRRGRADGLPRRPKRRRRGLPERLAAAGQRHLLGHPVAGRERRVEPLDARR